MSDWKPPSPPQPPTPFSAALGIRVDTAATLPPAALVSPSECGINKNRQIFWEPEAHKEQIFLTVDLKVCLVVSVGGGKAPLAAASL